MTGDLFEVDKRLALKPIVEFNAYLRAAFADGPCACGRCVASQGDEWLRIPPQLRVFRPGGQPPLCLHRR